MDRCRCIPYTPWHAVATGLLLVALLAAIWKDDLDWQWLTHPLMWICGILGLMVGIIATVTVFWK